MSVTIWWRPKVEEGKAFHAGTSTDLATFSEIFGEDVSSRDVEKLRAMAAACGHKNNLWAEIADTLDRLSNDGADEIVIRVWGRW